MPSRQKFLAEIESLAAIRSPVPRASSPSSATSSTGPRKTYSELEEAVVELQADVDAAATVREQMEKELHLKDRRIAELEERIASGGLAGVARNCDLRESTCDIVSELYSEIDRQKATIEQQAQQIGLLESKLANLRIAFANAVYDYSGEPFPYGHDDHDEEACV